MNIIIFREWFNHKLYPILFSLCIIISLGAFLTLDALQQSVNEYVNANQKQIVGGDIVITDNQQWPDALLTKVSAIDTNNIVFDYQFNAIVYTQTESLLSRIKAVSSAYPLYGELILADGSKTWKPGSILVEKQVLSTLNVNIGDQITIGESQFIIHDEIITEPDRPLTAFGFGARIIMHESDLVNTQLMGQKSRINYRIEIKQAEQNIATLTQELTTLLANTKASVKTADQSNTSISNLSQNFLTFLKLLVIAVIVLSTIGIMSIVRSFVAKQQQTNAIRVALGEKSHNIISSYRTLLLFMALISVVFSWLLSIAVIHFGQDAFTAILPNDIDIFISWMSLLKAIIIAVILTALTTHVTLKNIHNIKPIAVLHKHEIKKHLPATSRLWWIFAALALFGLLYSELNNLFQSIQVFCGLMLVWLAFAILTKGLMRLIKWLLDRQLIKQWMVNLALQNIFRKGNQSHLFITSLSMTTMILGAITTLDYSIDQQLISAYPEDAPNMFLLDIQTDQQQQLDQMFEGQLVYYPVIRARIDSVNGVKAEVLKDQLGTYDNITRVFNLSYSNELLATERIEKSLVNGSLFTPIDDSDIEPISILDTIAGFLEVSIGDQITFNVQGVNIKTEVTSIRKRLKRGPSPFFYFIFPPEVMNEAPQIRFATAKVSDDKRVDMQTQIAKTFPGITTLDGGNIAKKLKEFTDQLKQLVQIFTALSLLAGGLIFASSLISTSQDRLRESFYYRMMGMQGIDLLKLSTIEFLALGLFAFNLGVVVAAVISYLICEYWFSLSFIFPWHNFLMATVILTAVLLIISFLYTRHVKQSKVVDYLRHES